MRYARTRRSRRWPWLLLVLLVACALGFWRAVRDPWPAQQGIGVPAGEQRDTARVIAATVALLDRQHVEGQPYLRAAFAKAHACLRASVEVPELEPRLRQGLFARPGRYEAWIRLSNGAGRPDSDQKRDAHGLALKVMGIPGPKLLANERDAETQDFLFADSPRFPVASVADYAELLESQARGERCGFFSRGSFLPWRWRVREAWLFFRARRAPPSSLLQERYFSASAFRLGPLQVVKLALRPCRGQRSSRSDPRDDMLRRRLKEELARGDSCLELLAQLQVPGRNMPIEDATVVWSEQDSPFLPLARITIPRQTFDEPEQDRFCEALSFTPWHSLPEHEPVGGLNRLRRAVYLELSRYRHARNGSALREPRGFCLDLSGASCPAAPNAPAPGTTTAPRPTSKPAARPTAAPPPLAEPRVAPPPTEAPTAAPPEPPSQEEVAPPTTEPSPPDGGG